MPTLADVASRSGVSKGAVSSVLRNAPGQDGVSAETRQRILHVVRELGYRPHPLAASLRTRRTRTIGLVVGEPESFLRHPNQALMMGRLLKQASEMGYRVTLMDDAWQDSPDPRLLDGCAVLTWVPSAGIAQVERLAAEIPVVSLYSRIRGAVQVVMDEGTMLRRGMREGAAWLYGLGHRRIALVDVNHPKGPDTLRKDAFAEVAREQGILPELLCYADRWQERLYPTAAEIAQLDPPPTAAVALDDDYARALIAHLARRGLRVPEDVSVFSGNTQQDSFQTPPALTGLARDLTAQWGELMRRFIRLLGNDPAEEIVVPPAEFTLVVRESCAPPRAR